MTELIGHKNIKKQLSDIIKNNRIGHAYIFEGARGIGKTTAAFWFAQNLVCDGQTGVPCQKCVNCIKSSAGSHPDISLIDESFINNPKIKPGSVDAVRIVKKSAYTTPIMAKRKVYIIPDGDDLLFSAQNTLLKVLEEPPEYCTIIILCENKNKLLQTITSRAVTIKFSPLSDEEMREYFSKKQLDVPENLIKICNGSPAMAEEFISDSDSYEDFENVVSEFRRYLQSNGDMSDILPLVTKENADFTISCMEYCVTENLYVGDNTSAYITIFDILQNARRRLKLNCNFNLTIADMLIKSWEAIHG